MQAINLVDFKTELKSLIKPDKFKHFHIGPKESNSLLTRLRIGRTSLNSHRYTIGQSDEPSCICHAKQESSEHFFLDCFLYTVERQTLFNLAEQIVPRFSRMNKKEKFQLFTRGINIKNPDFYHVNRQISLGVQYFILKTKRFVDAKVE